MSGPEPIKTLLALRSVDPIARLAEAWEMAGRHAFLAGGGEHLALLGLAHLPAELAKVRWDRLTAEQRRRLMIAARQAVELGRLCAWVFGEGQGA
jgi:hypothetical protein